MPWEYINIDTETALFSIGFRLNQVDTGTRVPSKQRDDCGCGSWFLFFMGNSNQTLTTSQFQFHGLFLSVFCRASEERFLFVEH